MLPLLPWATRKMETKAFAALTDCKLEFLKVRRVFILFILPNSSNYFIQSLTMPAHCVTRLRTHHSLTHLHSGGCDYITGEPSVQRNSHHSGSCSCSLDDAASGAEIGVRHLIARTCWHVDCGKGKGRQGGWGEAIQEDEGKGRAGSVYRKRGRLMCRWIEAMLRFGESAKCILLPLKQHIWQEIRTARKMIEKLQRCRYIRKKKTKQKQRVTEWLV